MHHFNLTWTVGCFQYSINWRNWWCGMPSGHFASISSRVLSLSKKFFLIFACVASKHHEDQSSPTSFLLLEVEIWTMQNKIYLVSVSKKNKKIWILKSGCFYIDVFPHALFSIIWHHVPTSVHQADESRITSNCSYKVA